MSLAGVPFNAQDRGRGAVSKLGACLPQAESGFKEERRLAIAMTGRRNAAFWSGADRDAKFDMYDLKGILEEFFEQFGLRGFSFARAAEGNSFYVESANIQLGKLALGEMGRSYRPCWASSMICGMRFWSPS